MQEKPDNRTIIRVRDNWFRVCEDFEKEVEKVRSDAERNLKEMEQRALKA